MAGAPPFAEVWPRFREFVGADLLVAHNGLAFDVPVLRRHVALVGGAFEGIPLYDTLPEARALFRAGASLQSLAGRFGIDPGTAHHALDDAVTLAGVLRGLGAARAARTRKTAFQQGPTGLASLWRSRRRRRTTPNPRCSGTWPAGSP